MPMKKIRGLFALMRVDLPVSAGVCVVMGQMLALGGLAPLPVTLAAFVSIFCISASILVLNDIIDVETDRINAPHRPIPSGAVTPAEALILSIGLIAAGFSLSLALHPAAPVVAAVLTAVGFLYNRFFKKSGLPGNVLVSFSVGMTFVYGGISVGLPFSPAACFFGLIAALVDLGEEIAADAMDAEGDRLIGSRSLAILYGRRAALRTSFAIFTLVIMLSFVPFLLGWFTLLYLAPVLVMDGAIGYSAFGLVRSKGEEGRGHIRRLYLGATAGLVVFIVMRLAGV